MEVQKVIPKETSELASNQTPHLLPEEVNKQLAEATQRGKAQVLSLWQPHVRAQIRELETQIKQRETDIKRTTELCLKMHEDIARWTLEKVQASATLKEMEGLAEAMKPSPKTEEVD